MFGSFARNEQRPTSDVDLAVISDLSRNQNFRVEMFSALNDLLNGIEFDIVFGNNAQLESGSGIYKNIKRDGIVIWENMRELQS